MRVVLLVGAVLAMVAGGCGGNEPPAESPSNATATTPAANDGSRHLTKNECDALSQSIVDACNNRGNDRSAEADGWCSDMVSKNSGDAPTWVANDCVPHFRYMDRFCFEGAKNAHAMMDCDKTVDRVQ